MKLLKYDKLAILMLLLNWPLRGLNSHENPLTLPVQCPIIPRSLGVVPPMLPNVNNRPPRVLITFRSSLGFLYRQNLIYADQLSITFVWSTTTANTLIQQPYALFTYMREIKILSVNAKLIVLLIECTQSTSTGQLFIDLSIWISNLHV